MSPVRFTETLVQAGGGPNPVDAFSLGIRIAEASVAPTDAMSVAFTFPESNFAPSELLTLGLAFADTNPALSEALIRLGLGLAESSAAPTDAATYLLSLSQAESLAAAVDALTLAFTLADSSTAPSDGRSGLAKCWGTGSTGTSNVTTPANANGPNDGTTAVVKTVAAGATTETLTSPITQGPATGTPFTTVIARCWYRLQTTLSTSTAKLVLHSSSALFSDITLETLSATNGDSNHLTTPFASADLSATLNTIAKVKSAQFLYSTTDAAAGVSPAVATVDASSLELSGVL